MVNSNENTVVAKERTMGRQLARELTNDEVNTVSGGLDAGGAGDYTPTGKPESDCD